MSLLKFAVAGAVLIFVFLPKPLWSEGEKLLNHVVMTAAFIFGMIFSAAAGKIGIMVATIANQKTAEAAKSGISKSFLAGFRGGAVMGMAVVGSSLFGIALLTLVIGYLTKDYSALIGFSFGASGWALFAKAGAASIPRPRTSAPTLSVRSSWEFGRRSAQSAVIADNVGDNVGTLPEWGLTFRLQRRFDCCCPGHGGFPGSKLGESAFWKWSSSTSLWDSFLRCSGVMFARMGRDGNPTRALNIGTYLTTGLFAVLTAVATFFLEFEWRVWGASVVGLLVGVIIGLTTDYFTNDLRKPVRMVAKASKSGPAFTILSGVSYGFLSVLPAMIGIAISALAAFMLCKPLGTASGLEVEAGMFGVAMAAVGMLSIVGMIVSNDAYGPIVDNARGLAEMGGLGEDVIETTDKLDSAGNTVKAVTKGFSIGAAGLTVISLLFAFVIEVNDSAGAIIIQHFDIMNPIVFFGMIVGAAVPAVFSALLMLGVDRNAQRMVEEIHRQFEEIPGLKEGKEGVEPEYDKCIMIATTGALRELLPAGLFAIAITLVVGFVGGVTAIGGFLAGTS